MATEFYKKLIKTDAQIRNLKKNNEPVNNMDDIEDKYRTYPERAKRSLKIFYDPRKLFLFRKNKKIRANKVSDERDKIVASKDNIKTENSNSKDESKAPITATKDSKKNNLKTSRKKRFYNTSEPGGFLIENKKFLIQYKPKHINRKSKCSHVPKESKSHENQLKHPFYQNTQRLDELLDNFLNKNFPEIMTDKFGLDMIFGKDKNKCKHPKIEEDKLLTTKKTSVKAKTVAKIKDEKGFGNVDDDFSKSFKTETTVQNDNVFDDLEFGNANRKREETSTTDYGLVMSLSTLMYSG